METAFVKTARKEFPHSTEHIATNWIAGKWISSGKTGTSIDPCTGESIGSYSDGGLSEAELAIKAASAAFNETAWKNDHMFRSKILLSIADAIERTSEKLVQILCREVGKIASEAAMEVAAAPPILRYWAGNTFTAGRAGEVVPGTHSVTIREAIGVAGIIAPFNAPVALTVRSLAPALAAGATAVVKLPGVTAQTNFLLSTIFSSIPELPPGIINVITESNSEVAKLLVESPEVPVISFTGSSSTGRIIAAAGAARLKRMVMELGGKTPMIVFDDADLDTAVFTIAKAITLFSGQFCMTGSRILVQKNIADCVRQRLAELLENVRLGPGLEAGSEMGAMINKASVARVNELVEDAIAAGARVIVRGGPITQGALAAGAFYKPTLLEITNPKMAIVQQEIFGPVATLQVFDTEEEAIQLANDSEYGLAASIWSQDAGKPWRIAKSLRAGTIWINTYARIFPQFEEGGYQQSGIGRLNGETAIDNFLEYKHIVLKY